MYIRTNHPKYRFNQPVGEVRVGIHEDDTSGLEATINPFKGPTDLLLPSGRTGRPIANVDFSGEDLNRQVILQVPIEEGEEDFDIWVYKSTNKLWIRLVTSFINNENSRYLEARLMASDPPIAVG